jgi:rhomboid-like protein
VVTDETADEATLTWRDYDPDGGMPLPDGERSAADIHKIFGSDLDVETGNYILSVMYWRRISGALIDVGASFPNESGVTREQALRGLEYIRAQDLAFDEEAAGQRWAEEETERVREELKQRAVKLGLYKAEEEVEIVPEEEKQGTEQGRQKTGESVLIQVREENERKYELEKAAKELAEERAKIAAVHAARGPLELLGGVQPRISLFTNLVGTGSGELAIGSPESGAWLQPVTRQPWVKYYEEQAAIIKDNEIPQLSTLQRLGPAFLVLLITLGGCYYVGSNYTPPPQSARMFPDTPPSVATIAVISGLLVTSFFANRLPPLWRTYSKYFSITPGYPNALSILGASWRHDNLRHLLTNVAMLWGFGLLLHEDLGRGGFVALYLATGAIGGFSSLASEVFRKRWMTYIFGSSGNMLGIAAAVCALHPYGNVQVLGQEIPMSGWVLLGLGTAWIGLGAYRGVAAIDHAGHIAGLISGGAMGWKLRQESLAKKRAASQVETASA